MIDNCPACGEKFEHGVDLSSYCVWCDDYMIFSLELLEPKHLIKNKYVKNLVQTLKEIEELGEEYSFKPAIIALKKWEAFESEIS